VTSVTGIAEASNIATSGLSGPPVGLGVSRLVMAEAASRPARPRFRDATDNGHSGYIHAAPLRCGIAKPPQQR